MKYARFAAVVLCIVAWAWFGWHYAIPMEAFYFSLLEQRQVFVLACVSWFLTLCLKVWVYYLAVMNLKRAIDAKLAPWPMELLGYATVLPPALFLDWLMNMLLTFVTFDPPTWWGELVTGRLKRYAYEPQYFGTWRQRFAKWFALILDAADPSGKHV